MLSQPENVDFVNGIFGAHVLKDAFVNLRISDERDAAAGSAVAFFLRVLKSRPNIFVDAWCRVCEAACRTGCCCLPQAGLCCLKRHVS